MTRVPGARWCQWCSSHPTSGGAQAMLPRHCQPLHSLRSGWRQSPPGQNAPSSGRLDSCSPRLTHSGRCLDAQHHPKPGMAASTDIIYMPRSAADANSSPEVFHIVAWAIGLVVSGVLCIVAVVIARRIMRRRRHRATLRTGTPAAMSRQRTADVTKIKPAGRRARWGRGSAYGDPNGGTGGAMASPHNDVVQLV